MPTVATVAVNVTPAPNVDGLSELTTDVAEVAWFTVCKCTADVPPLKFGAPA